MINQLLGWFTEKKLDLHYNICLLQQMDFLVTYDLHYAANMNEQPLV